MPILSDSKQRYVEKLPIGYDDRSAVVALECRLVSGGSLLRREALCRNRMDLVVGNGDSRKEGIARHPVIAVAVVVRYEPLVTPEPMRATPWKARSNLRRGEAFIESLRCRSSREAHGKSAIASLCKSAEPFGHAVRERFSILEYVIFDQCIVHHGSSL